MSTFIKKWLVFFPPYLRVHHFAKEHLIDSKEFSADPYLSKQLLSLGISFGETCLNACGQPGAPYYVISPTTYTGWSRIN